MEPFFSYEHAIRYSECDCYGRLALHSICEIFQEAATVHAERLGVGQTYCERERRLWLLSRLRVIVDRYPGYGDGLWVETWPSGFSGPLAIREYQLRVGDEVVVRATGSWLMVDPESGRPVRPKDYAQHLPAPEDRHVVDEPAPKVSIPQDARERSARTVSYTDLDQNLHTNNTHYVRWCENVLPIELLSDGGIRDFVINYRKESALGDRIELFEARDDEGYYVEGRLGSDPAFSARAHGQGKRS